MTSTNTGVNQLELAGELGITDRRVRQLVQEFILPSADNETGLFDLTMCRSRYDLYRNGSAGSWEDFLDESVLESNKLKPALNAAMADAATLDDVRFASQTLQRVYARMRFLTACKSKSDAEREFHFLIWKDQEDGVMGGLIHRTMELLGETHLRNDATGELVEIIPPGAARRRRPPSEPGKPGQGRQA